MVRIPRADNEKATIISAGDLVEPDKPRVAKIPFPEPNHTRELEMRAYYEGVRDDGWAWAYEGEWDWRDYYILLELPEQPAQREQAPGVDDYPDQYWCAKLPCRDEDNSSHQPWAVERFGWPRCCAKLRKVEAE